MKIIRKIRLTLCNLFFKSSKEVSKPPELSKPLEVPAVSKTSETSAFEVLEEQVVKETQFQPADEEEKIFVRSRLISAIEAARRKIAEKNPGFRNRRIPARLIGKELGIKRSGSLEAKESVVALLGDHGLLKSRHWTGKGGKTCWVNCYCS